MSTAADITRDALTLLGVLAAGEAARAEDVATCLRHLNLMLGSWANKRMLVHGARRSEHALSSGTSPHTIGTGGTINVARPLRIDGAGLKRSGETRETPIDIITDRQHQDIVDKSETGSPSKLWVEWTHPRANLWLWPVPDAADTLVLYTWSRIAAFVAADDVDLPDGYENALAHGLALQVAPIYGVAPSTQLLENHEEAIGAVKRTNDPQVVSQLDAALAQRGGDDEGPLFGPGGGYSPGGLF